MDNNTGKLYLMIKRYRLKAPEIIRMTMHYDTITMQCYKEKMRI